MTGRHPMPPTPATRAVGSAAGSVALRAALWAAGCAACAQPGFAATPAQALAERADRIVQEVAQQAHFNGAVVLMRDGQVVYERAVGLAQRQPDRPYTTDTPSDGGSLAKTMTAAALWELAADGRLKLDDPVVRHLPEYPNGQHKVRDLVTHRNGLPDYDFFDADFKPGQVRDTGDLLAVLARRKPPSLAPGVQVEYSNLGFDTAALVIERISGQKIGAWWRERYFKRLGIEGAFARPARFADWPVPRAPGYRRKGAQWELFDAFDGEGFIGASNVHAGARDWARWGDAFAREIVLPKERLDAGLREPMFDSGMDQRLNLLSWYCDAGQQRCHYTGSYNAFFAQVYWDRARREVVAFVSNSTLPHWRSAALTRDLVAALAGRAPTPEAVKAPLRIGKKDLPRWAGDYVAPGVGSLALSLNQGRAFVRVGGGELASLYPVPGGAYYAPTLDLTLAFSGSPENATLHVRSVFHMADAKRKSAPAGSKS